MRELAAHPDVSVRPDLREQGRGRRRQQPAPALPDLRDELHLQVHRDGAAAPAAGISQRPAACCSRTSSPRSDRTGAGSSASTAAPSRSCRTSRATPTRPTSRRCGASRRLRIWTTRSGATSPTVLRDVVIRFDNLWRMPFPYVMALHQAPVKGETSGLPLPHRVPSAAAPAEPAQVPRRSGDWRRQLPQRHVAGREGGGARRRRRAALPAPALRDMTPLAPSPAARADPGPARRIRRRCRRARASRLRSRRSRASRARTKGDTIYAIDRVAEDVLVAEIARTIATPEAPVLLVAEGLPGGEVVLPEGADRTHAALDDHRRSDRRHARPDVPEAAGLDPDRRGAPDPARARWRTSSSRCRRRFRSSSSTCPTSCGRFEATARPRDRFNRLTGESAPLILQPSTATTIAHGFATISRFFPGNRAELAAIDDEIVGGGARASAAGQGAARSRISTSPPAASCTS